jgi:glycosyltransferase involved in cell wall biosynthesis
MKIAFLNDTFLEGRGADVVMYELSKRIGKKNDVYIISGETNIKEENFKFIKINLPKLVKGRISDFLYFQKMKNLKTQIEQLDKQYNFDKIIVFHGGLSPAFSSNKKVIYVWLGSPPTKNILRKVASKFFQKKMINNKIITISQFLQDELEMINARNVRKILLGVSEEFKPLKKSLDERYMLYVGRLEKHKNVKELIALSKEINFKLKIAGYGTQKEDLEESIKKLNAPVELLGRVSREKLIELYQKCSFFISASKWEGFGLIFIEAAACEKPSIGYNYGAIPEVILDKKTGFIVNNHSELIKKSELLSRDQGLRNKLGKNALELKKKFDWEIVSQKFLKEIK